MKRDLFSVVRGLSAAALCVCVGMGGGCNEHEQRKPKSKTMEGVITRLEIDKGRLAMKMRDPKDKSQFLPQEIEGSVTPTTELWINGKAAKMADLRVSDKVEATGYRQGKGENEQIIAEKLSIERPEAVLPKPMEAPPGTPPPAAASTAPAAAESTPAGLNPKGVELMRQLVREIKKQRGEFAAQKAKLLKEGRPADDREVLELDARVAKADMTLAQVEDEAGKKGLDLSGDVADSSQPASAPSAP